MTIRDKRRAKIRRTIKGISVKPRLVVFRSNRYFYAQIVDDSKGHTLVSVNKERDAAKAGEEIGKAAVSKGFKKIVFDRAGYKYHGNVKKIADGARSAGLEF